MTATALRYCSEKQAAFITRLLSEKTVSDEVRSKIGDPARLEVKSATKVIDWLLKQPTQTRADAVTAEGMYLNGTAIYRVKRSKTSGNLYAQRLLGNQYVYEAGSIRTLTASMRMTLEQAKAYGQQTGTCCVCAATLTDPKSIAAGIGPVCANRI